MKRKLILAVTVFATAHAQVNSPTNAASTVTGAIVPSGQGGVGPAGSISANAQSITPNGTSGAGGVGGSGSSSAGCLNAIPSTAGGVGARDLFGGIGGC